MKHNPLLNPISEGGKIFYMIEREDLLAFARTLLESRSLPSVLDSSDNESKYIFGLAGIRKEFGCGHNTAQRLKDGPLREAVMQAGPGCKIIMDKELARKLYSDYVRQNDN